MRTIRIATTSFLIEDYKHTIDLNIEKSFYYIEQAFKFGADIICLPEAVLTQNTKESEDARCGVYPVEKFPGKITKIFCQKAKQKKINIILPNYILEKGKIYNQATIIDKKGKVAGHYRKVQPTYTEIKTISPGNELPVFDLEFGKIAIMICMDIYFPEIVRVYAFKGAEIIFWPTLTHGPTQAGLENQMRSRALNNSIYIVQSNIACNPPYAPYNNRYQPGRANIVDHNGDIIADTGRRHGICYADIDLNEVRITSGVIGITEPDRIREDLQSITRLDLYIKEYKKIQRLQKKNFEYLKK